ncbi:MAG: aspartate aminotransferase family protein [Candidatus Hydrogenedentota bacterium]
MFFRGDDMTDYVMNTYSRFDIHFTKGDGVYIYDSNEKRYLDLLSGIAVCSLGHCHPELVETLYNQSKQLWHTSNLFKIELQERLAKKLCEISGMSAAFFCNSGAEANEAGLKLIRYYNNTNATGRNEIICMYNSFHGRTLATLSATGQTKYQKGFEPAVPGFKFIEYNNSYELLNHITNKTTAIMLELIQGEGGIIPATKDFVDTIKTIKEKNKEIFIIVDEVQTGGGRLGEWFAFQHFGLSPDIVTLAKGIAGGFPIGVMLVSERYKDILKPGTHASTFGGNFLACACALKVIEIIERDNLLMNVKTVGEYLKNELIKLFEKEEVRGMGLMLGIEGEFDARKITNESLKNGLIVGVSGEKILRFLPPFIVKKNNIDEALLILKKVRCV